MLTITLNLSKKAEQQLIKDFEHLEILTGEPRKFHIQKAVIRYLQHANKLRKNYDKEKTKDISHHVINKLLENLNLKELDV